MIYLLGHRTRDHQRFLFRPDSLGWGVDDALHFNNVDHMYRLLENQVLDAMRGLRLTPVQGSC